MTPTLYVLTDPAVDRDRTSSAIAKALAAVRDRMGVVVRDTDEAFAARIAQMCRDAGARCFVKADEALVQRIGATGPHVGSRQFGATGANIGAYTASAHDLDEAKRVKDAHAIFVGPIFDVPGKGPAQGTDLIRRVRTSLPDANLYALGGITADNARACIEAGAKGVAVIRAVLAAEDPAEAALALAGAFR